MRTACFAVIDSGVDAGYAAFERAASRQASAATRAVPADAPRRARRRTLSELPSTPGAHAAPAEADDAATATEAAVSVPARVPDDATTPLQHLRTARLGLAVAVALLFLVLYLRATRR